MEIKNKVLRGLLNLDFLLTAIALIVITAVTFLGVIMRYCFNSPITWLQEVQLWCFVWIVFFGAGAAFRTNSHVAIEILVDTFPPFLKKIVEVFIYVVVLGVLGFLTVQGINLVIQMLQTERTTDILNIPFWFIYSAFPIGCVWMIVNHTLVLVYTLFLGKDVKGGAN